MTESDKETTKNASSTNEPVKTTERAKDKELSEEELRQVSGGFGGSHGDDTPTDRKIRSTFQK
jgi:bacteriocin-like protein